MKYSIFHTSHCGSTLLASLLSKSIDSYSEPRWSHQINVIPDKLDFINRNHSDNTLVKYPSPYCYLMPHIEGKKIFLYNKLYHHLIKHMDNQGGLEFQRDIMRNKFHKKSSRHVYPQGQDVGEKAYLWADRFYYAFDSNNTIFIDCDDLFKSREYVLEKICAFLEIEYIPVNIDFHVKSAGLLHSEIPINVDNIPNVNKGKKVEPYKNFNKTILEWCYETYGAKGIISSFIY